MLSDLYVAESLAKYREMELQKAALHAWKFPKKKSFKRKGSLFSRFNRSQNTVCCQPCC
ncbi:hypothetical protein PaeBR_20745 [Paenibacillus sp. BR2-3]|uniref:hypothetical protein n=1 Tax=Paenibacillus sp. BR2-3 TaxID=3048494 RepID=UPI0039773008